MSDSLGKTWPADPHTLAKHEILTGYLRAWSTIMAHHAGRSGGTQKIRFIDAFAGPGKYKGGEPGSPILALRAAVEHRHQFPVPIRYLFIEQDKDRFEMLKTCLREMAPQLQGSRNVHLEPPQNGDCIQILNALLTEAETRREPFGPALVFLDQFGYSDVPMSLIRRIMSFKSCEVFTYLNYSGLNRFFSDDRKDEARRVAFGTDEWKQARELKGDARNQFILQLYKRKLREIGNAKYVWDFAMADHAGVLQYWLFFCTNSEKGLKEMKGAMRRVDDTLTFRFADNSDPSQLHFFHEFNEEQLEKRLVDKFEGQVVSVRDVREFVYTETPYNQYAQVMQSLARRELVTPIPGGKVSYEEDLDRQVRFNPKPLFWS